MKQAGLVILIIGVLVTAFAGFKFVTKKKVVDIGKLEITKDESHVLDWSPIAGVGIMIIGGGMFFFGAKKS